MTIERGVPQHRGERRHAARHSGQQTRVPGPANRQTYPARHWLWFWHLSRHTGYGVPPELSVMQTPSPPYGRHEVAALVVSQSRWEQ